MKLDFEHYREAYDAWFRNRDIVNRRIDLKEIGLKYFFQSLFYSLFVVLKVFLSIFVKKRPKQETLFVSWNKLHSTLAERIGQKENLVVLNYHFEKDQINFFKNISIFLAIKYSIKIMLSRRRTDNSYDNIFFCFASVLEFQMLRNLVMDARHIYMAGQADRYAIMLSILGREGKKYFSFVQHGVNNVFEGLYLLSADEIYYLFEISIPFFNAFILDAEKKKYIPIPSVRPDFKTDASFNNAIALASQILPSDLEILDILVEHYKNGDILIYPHPTEKSIERFKKYETQKNVIISWEKISNINYLFSTGSTLGIEYDLIGVPPVFINTLNIKSEIFLSEKFITFQDVNSFKGWFLDVVATRPTKNN